MANHDVAVAAVGFSGLDNKPIKITPIYLATFEDPKKKLQQFLATKFDETANCAKFVGIETTETIDNINKNYRDILNTTDKMKYKEIMIPWHRIICIQNLIFRQK